MSAHLCITTYKTPNNQSTKLELCFVGQDVQRIPSILGATYGLQTKRLDLSYNSIKSLEGMDKFPFLEELILDNNLIDDQVEIPDIGSLTTLSLNKNKITDLYRLLDQLSNKIPHLRYLSLLGNTACPDQLSPGKSDLTYKRYRILVLQYLPRLRFLDSSAVRKSEARKARSMTPIITKKITNITLNGSKTSINSTTIKRTYSSSSLQKKYMKDAPSDTSISLPGSPKLPTSRQSSPASTIRSQSLQRQKHTNSSRKLQIKTPSTPV